MFFIPYSLAYNNKYNYNRDTRIRDTIHEPLCAETVECTPGPLESIDNVECSDGFPLRVLSVGDGVTDDLKQ